MPLQRVVYLAGILSQFSGSRPILRPNLQQILKYRCVSVNNPKHAKALKTEKEKVRMFIVSRYIDYVKGYMGSLQARFPTAVKMYRVFSVGIKDFFRDLKTYISLRLKMSKDRGFSNMTRQDIELYQKMPSDMWRIAPVLILSALPFGNYVIFPLAFLRPKTLLCSHFWSIQQRLEFSRQDLTDRIKNNKPVLRALQAKFDMLPDSPLREKLRRVLALLGSGVHPTPTEVIECKQLFTKEPYELTHLTYAHQGYLLSMHGLRRSILRTNKLKYQAFMLLEMDKAISREGGVGALNMEALRNACHIRGLNSMHLSNQDMRDWLEQWLTVSAHVDKSAYSLILHCPVFLAYNHPQNWVLIY